MGQERKFTKRIKLNNRSGAAHNTPHNMKGVFGMTSAYISKINGELRVYNRDNTKANNRVAFPKEEKAVLKKLGFVWDRQNHSYFLENPSNEAIVAIRNYVVIENDVQKEATVKSETNGASLQTVIEKLEQLFSKLNHKFYADKLTAPVITISPEHKNGVLGWCTSWKAWKGADDGGYYEINLCAEYLSRPFLEICETMLHEMVHLWNVQNDVKDTSRSSTYHNKKFKDAAESHGLTCEKGKSGWNRTALTEETADWLKSEFADEAGFALHRSKMMKLSAAGGKQSSRKYVCPLCAAIVRATKEVNIKCSDCNVSFELSA